MWINLNGEKLINLSSIDTIIREFRMGDIYLTFLKDKKEVATICTGSNDKAKILLNKIWNHIKDDENMGID